ncbi:MAG: hypothetical protein HZB40_17440 [Rhodocyclales bacterium]|nr:hypothetical protein [Rhodocyclales bacterium]
MAESKPLSPTAAHVLGLLLIACGALIALAAFGIGPLRDEGINGPAMLGVAAGGCFGGAGLALIAGPQSPLAARLFGILALGGLAVIGNWVAFGGGGRDCGGSVSLAFIGISGRLTDLSCRIPFGIGALACDGMLAVMAARTLQFAAGGPPRLATLVRAADWLLLASLAPILLPLLLFALGSAAAGAVATRIRSGAWPRNEAFIARQKERLAKLRAKPPAGSS